MGAVDKVQSALRRELQGGAVLGFFQQGVAAEHRAELFGPLIAGDMSGKGLKPGAVAAGQDHRPLVAPRVSKIVLLLVLHQVSPCSAIQYELTLLSLGSLFAALVLIAFD